MGIPKKPRDVKLIIGMLAKNKKLFKIVEEFFITAFGEIDYRSSIILFEHTDYYKKEMGRPLYRQFISFKKLVHPQQIARIKLITNAIEKKFSVKKSAGLKRQINIDPGYVSDSKLILATTKDYYHRIYLNNGIYAEVTLYWKKKSFQAFEWTYPDYRSKAYIEIMNFIRNIYTNR